MTALAALLLVLQVAPPAPAIAVDPAIAAVVTRFYETQEKEDIESYLALWSPSAAIAGSTAVAEAGGATWRTSSNAASAVTGRGRG